MNRRYSILWAKEQKYIVQYDAPKWMDSPEAWAIIDDVVDGKDITALIYQRASLKYIKIFSESDNKKFYIKKLKDLPSSAKKYQIELFDSLFKKDDEYHFSEDSDSLYKHVSKAKKWLMSYIDAEKWYLSKFDYVAWEKSDFKTNQVPVLKVPGVRYCPGLSRKDICTLTSVWIHACLCKRTSLHSFSWLSNIPRSMRTTSSLSIHLSVGI